MDGNGLKSNRQSAHFGDCVVSVSKIISKKIPARLLFRPKNIIKNLRKLKKIKKIKKIKFAGSIIGPAMAGPAGPFATALLCASLDITVQANIIKSFLAICLRFT